MIAVHKEQLIALRDAPKHLPTRPGGKRLHVSAVYRWIKKGVGGVRLESIRLGGTTYTSLEALQRFAERLSNSGELNVQKSACPRPSKHDVARCLEIELGLAPASLTGPSSAGTCFPQR